MSKINNLKNFFKLNNFLQELKYLKKIATPLDAEYLPEKDRSEVLDKTKKITPNIYIAKNLFDEELFRNITKEVAEKKFFLGQIESSINTYIAKFINFIEYAINRKTYKDKFGTKTVALSKDELLKALESSASLGSGDQYLAFKSRFDRKNILFIYKKIYEELLLKINLLPSGYDLYFIPAINTDISSESAVDFDYNKSYIYHDFIGHGFESLFLSFRKLIRDYMANILKDIFLIDASNWRMGSVLEKFIEIFGKDNFNKLFGQEVASGILDTDDAIRDSYYDLFSILLNNDIKIENIQIGNLNDSSDLEESKQKIFDSLSYTLEVELNAIKDELIQNLNEELESMGDEKYLIQFLTLDQLD